MAIRTLGSRYLLEETIGQGGMGVVWRGRDRETGAQYAIKVLRPEYSADPEAVTRFVRERTALMRFRHPAVVTVHDMIVEGDQLALVMDLVPDGDLTRYQRRRGGTLPPDEVARISAQICDGLGAAHDNGIVHRDLKPANVLLDNGRVKLADFGVARIVGDSSATSSGIVLGTAGYLAPEMLTGSEPSPACDMYALGITMYEMLAGRPPFTGHVAAVMHDHLDTPPARIPGLPDRLWKLVNSCLAKTPQNRPTAAAMATALREPALTTALAAVPAAPATHLPAPGEPSPVTGPSSPADRTGPTAALDRSSAGLTGPASASAGLASAGLASAGLAPASDGLTPAGGNARGLGRFGGRPRVLAAAAATVALVGVVIVALLASSAPPGHKVGSVASAGAAFPTAVAGSQPTSAVSPSPTATRHHHRKPKPSHSGHPALPTAVPTPSRTGKPRPGLALAPYGPNLIADGNFGDGMLGPWQASVNAAVMPGYGPGGQNAVRLTASPTAGIIELVAGLTPGASYEVTGWGQAQGAKLFIGAADDNQDLTDIAGISFTSPGWRRGSAIFKLGKGQTTAKVFCVQQGGATGYCANITFRAMRRK